eukprot:3279064-Pyramimonas_sp.AAC.1
MVCAAVGVACECTMVVLAQQPLAATQNKNAALYRNMLDDCEAVKSIVTALLAPEAHAYIAEELEVAMSEHHAGMGDAPNLPAALLTELSTKERAIASDVSGERLATL